MTQSSYSRRHVALGLAAALSMAPIHTSMAQTVEPLRPRITVTGEGTTSVEPDLAQVRAGVTSDAKTAREAAEINARSMNAVMAAIKNLGVVERDVQTSRYSIQAVYESGPQSRNRLTGFQATNSVLIRVRQLDKIDDLVDGVIAAGANTMGGIEFLVSEPSRHLDEARRQAVADARRKAELYAEAAGVKLGAAIEISENSGATPYQPAMMARSAAAPSTPISAGDRTLRAGVTVTYELLR